MDSKFDTDFFLCKCSDIKDIGLRKISKYYLNLLNCWSEFLAYVSRYFICFTIPYKIPYDGIYFFSNFTGIPLISIS
jgi:hypothetical protein